MTRVPTIATIAILSSILTPVVVSATGLTQKPAQAEQQQAKVETAAATSAPAAGEPTCTRRVKVVYAGYGEGQRAACTVTADARR